MGTKTSPKRPQPEDRASLADALFSVTQQRVLGYLFGQPDRSFFATELIKLTRGGSGAVQRELARLTDSGLVTVMRFGTQKRYQANRQSPVFEELCAIAQKTIGLADPLRNALAPLAPRILAAFVFGSVASKRDTASSDIDVLVLSEDLDYADLFGALQLAETKLGRLINPTVYTPIEWRKRLLEGNAFVVKAAKRPKIFLLGTENDLA